MSKRTWITSGLLLIIVVSLIMALSGSLDGAAAWANILALPVAIVGVIFGLRGADKKHGASQQDPNSRQDPSESTDKSIPTGGGTTVSQVGLAVQGNQFNVAGDYIARDLGHTGDRPSDG